MDMMIQTMDCSNIAKIKAFGNSHLPKLSKESIDNIRFIGDTVRFNSETELFIDEITSNPAVDLEFLKKVQYVIFNLSFSTKKFYEISEDKHMKIFLKQCKDIYDKLNQKLVDEISKRFDASLTNERRQELASKYNKLMKSYSN